MINIHIKAWKNYCNSIHENNNKQTTISQIHQDKIHDICDIKDATNGLTIEQSKQFDIEENNVRQINLPAINRWIAIVKRVVRSSKRRQRDEKKNKLTKYINLTTIKTFNPIQIPVNQPKRKLIQPSITTFTTTKPAYIPQIHKTTNLRPHSAIMNASPIIQKTKEWKRIVTKIKSVHSFSTTFTKNDIRKNHVRTDNESSNITLPSVSKNNKDFNPRPTTRNYEHEKINLILQKNLFR